MSKGRESNGLFCNFTVGSKMYGSRTSWPEFGSGKVISARVPVISGEFGLIPHATHPEGDINVPEKTKSRVELCLWNVHAIDASWEGNDMHFSNVLVVVVVVQWAEKAL